LSIVTVSGTGYSSSAAGTVAQDGSFTIAGIAPGEHTLRVERRRGAANAEAASVPVTVGSDDVTGLRVALSPGTRVTGRVIWEGTAPRTGGPVPPRVSAQQTDPQRQFVMFNGTDPLANGTPDDEGNFALGGVAGRVFFSMNAPPGWAVKSVTLAGDDITDVPMDLTGIPSLSDLRIVLTDKLTRIAGQVKDQRGQPMTDYVVVVLGAQLQQEPVIAARSIRVIRPDNTGRFQLSGLRPGRYVAAAIEALEQGRQFAPEFQQQLRRGAREFTLNDGEAVTLELSLTPDL
jgi:hypothetical protein